MARKNSFTPDDIQALTQHFYANIREDDLLGPVFTSKVPAENWDEHIAHIGSFWASIFIENPAIRFNGNPLAKHAAIEGITPAHFTHWLKLFETSARKTLNEDKAHEIIVMAHKIAKSLQMGLAFHAETIKGESDHPFSEFSTIRRHNQL